MNIRHTDFFRREAKNSIALTRTLTSLETVLGMSVFNPHIGITIESFAPELNSSLLQKGRAVFEEMMSAPENKFLFDYPLAELIGNGRWMVVARRGDNVFGTLYAHFDEAGDLNLRGAAVDKSHAGYGISAAMGALAIMHGFSCRMKPFEVSGAIRQLPDGTLNEASRRSFLKLGLQTEEEAARTYLSGSFRDRHLFETAECDEHGPYIQYRRMRADNGVHIKAKMFLREWSQRHTPHKHISK